MFQTHVEYALVHLDKTLSSSHCFYVDSRMIRIISVNHDLSLFELTQVTKNTNHSSKMALKHFHGEAAEGVDDIGNIKST